MLLILSFSFAKYQVWRHNLLGDMHINKEVHTLGDNQGSSIRRWPRFIH